MPAPGARARNPGETRSKVAALFCAVGAHPQIFVAEGKGVGAIARQAVAGNKETIVAAGGDGTVSTVAAEVAGTGLTLGVLPLGTLNHFARDLRIPLHLEGAVRIVVDHHAVAVDVAEVNGRVLVNNSGLGIYPHIGALREAEQHWLKRGKLRALVSATLHVFHRFQFLDVRITGHGKVLVRKTPFIFIGNNEYDMTGFHIGLRTRLNAGKLSLYLTHRTGWLGLLRLATEKLFVGLKQAKNFEAYSVEEAFIEARRGPLLVSTDGEVTWMECRRTIACGQMRCASWFLKIEMADAHVDSSFRSALWPGRSDDCDAAARFYPCNQPRFGRDLRRFDAARAHA
jgi:diacylglycerol kinase family enzyme